ncbi:hemerythrin domain-containing protein [Rhizobiaceae bacterium BDR2-2]|uniref:Hemerythrin domain-containing protein n=1 Tax=Ectorhizobium quercum TaxID=2965071 RepID=A0AAE3N392_9HYPH|nr:hemerythrin domain-containing protein [Ectorhizobium quercum]MCX8999784.1 hemerythrin domain-containing protein [Ectorhizobium quercum]
MHIVGTFQNFCCSANGIADLDHKASNGFTLRWLNAAYREQLALCDALEEIADSLPANVNRQKCIYAAKALGPAIRNQHLYEENVLFPWLAGRPGAEKTLEETLSRLKYEHFEDECFAEELTDALLRLGAGAPVNMEAVGYMLRGFFEGLRRHIAFERDHLLRNLPEDTTVSRHQ